MAPPAAVQHFGAALTDFAETAALGVPTWLLLPWLNDWRWMQGREDTPWYPTMRLFRQGPEGLWPPVIERVAAELAARLAG